MEKVSRRVFLSVISTAGAAALRSHPAKLATDHTAKHTPPKKEALVIAAPRP